MIARLSKDQQLKTQLLSGLDTFLETFDDFWNILDKECQKKKGRPLPPVLKIALKQYYEEKAARLAVLMAGNSFTIEEAMEILPEATLLAYASEEKEKLEKIVMASRL